MSKRVLRSSALNLVEPEVKRSSKDSGDAKKSSTSRDAGVTVSKKRKIDSGAKSSKKHAIRVQSAENEQPQESNSKVKNFWLLKAEPDSRIVKGIDVKFSIDDLKDMETSPWDGVRNPEARNNMKKMKLDDLAFFYHSNCKEPGIVGIMKIVKEAYEDYTAFDTKHPYFDPKSDKEHPKWFMVDVGFVRKLKRIIPLVELKSYATSDLNDMSLIKRSRLSVTSVKQQEWDFILSLEEKQKV